MSSATAASLGLDLGSVQKWVGFLAKQHERQVPGLVTPAQITKQHGVIYQPKRGKCRRMMAQACYRNAALMALEPGNHLTYVEGWATCPLGISVEHAWCVDADGVVYDPTWTGGKSRPVGTEYFGVPIPAKVLTLILLETKNYGVFAQWWAWEKQVLPILQEEMPELLALA